MFMKQAVLRKGTVLVKEYPIPLAKYGSMVVNVKSSCISPGTELSGVKSSGKNLISRALSRPNEVKKVLGLIKSDGVKATIDRVRMKLEVDSPLGYSAAGVVVDLGENVGQYKIGDEVAVAGVGYANHAEYVQIPRNLVVKKPDGISFQAASTVALGAIAMQSVRRASLSLGESCVVIGAGPIGLLVSQMMKTSGIRVCVIDIDARRLAIAEGFGVERVIEALKTDSIAEVLNWSGGFGVDCVIFAANTEDSDTLSSAFRMCRKKGQVVLVGVSGMEISRSDIYAKELDFKISTSYGPGRYDRNYEELGIDYPYSYVRWTEQRNMEEYLRLLEIGSIDLDDIIEHDFSIEDAGLAYDELRRDDSRPLLITLNYESQSESPLSSGYKALQFSSKTRRVKEGVVNVALVGAGSFASAVHLPNILKLSKKFKLHAVCSNSGQKASALANQFLAEYATTKLEEVLEDPLVQLVFITTRHDSHGQLVLDSLQAGKNVFVEKPLATTKDQLDAIRNFYSGSVEDKPLLFVGYNRRFSVYAEEIRKFTARRINPLFMYYRMNAGLIPNDHWIHENGGRIVGEACHIIDLMTYLVGCSIHSISVQSLSPNTNCYSSSDNKSILLKFGDGSVGAINYFSVGNKGLEKEYMEVHFDGKSITLNDYKSLSGFGVPLKKIRSSVSRKGQLEELEHLYRSLMGSDMCWPIDLASLLDTTEATMAIVNDKD